MEPEFWLERWQRQQTGFHEGAPNTLLTTHFADLGLKAGGRIFVPLCGKSNDMRWLRAQGLRVVGAELSQLAAEQFFAEQDLVPEISAAGPMQRFEAGGVTIFVGDIFDLSPDILGPVDAVYDRAALVALPETLRPKYAAHLIALTNAAPQFLVTFEYDQTRQPGPPFSVPEENVQTYYSRIYLLDCAEVRDVPGGIRGLPAQECVWVMRQGRNDA